MKKINLSNIVFVLIVSLLIISFVLFFFNPGFVVQLIGIYSLYYIIPISLFLSVVDFSLNKQLNKKHLFRAIISIIILLVLSLAIRYFISSSFHIFP